MDYKSPKELSEYLLYLDTNSTAYNSYFMWKKHVTFLDYTVTYAFTCEMCIRLHLETFYGITKKVINDWGTYWNKAAQCKSPVFS